MESSRRLLRVAELLRDSGLCLKLFEENQIYWTILPETDSPPVFDDAFLAHFVQIKQLPRRITDDIGQSSIRESLKGTPIFLERILHVDKLVFDND